MAKINAPLFSLRASGTIAGALTFRRLQASAVVSSPPRPTTPPTAAQAACRLRASWAASQWRAASAATRDEWATLALAAGLPPFGLFMREFIAQRCTISAMPLKPVYQP